MTVPTLDILLATYNGATYLPAQLDSLLAQSWTDFRILIRDDGSHDETPKIIAAYEEKFSPRIHVLPTATPSGSAAGNFSKLLAQTTADYVMFCDQDDLWMPDKVAKTLAAMQAAEAEQPQDTPLLVHTNLAVVDMDLRLVSSSFWTYQKLTPRHADTLAGLLVQNVVTGCTVMINRALREQALPIPAEAVMHDWWLTLVARAFGEVVALPEATVQYRQHGANEVGAKRWNARYVLGKALTFFDRTELHASLLSTQKQAAAFLDRYETALSTSQKELLRVYANLDRASFVRKRRALLRYGFTKIGWIRNLALFLRV